MSVTPFGLLGSAPCTLRPVLLRVLLRHFKCHFQPLLLSVSHISLSPVPVELGPLTTRPPDQC